MKTRVLSMVVIASFIFSIGAIAQQKRQQGNRAEMSQERKEMMKKRFAQQRSERPSFFNDEQKEAMKAIHLETAKEVKPIKNELRELMAKQKSLTTAENADLNAINKNIDKMSDLKSELAKIQAKSHQEVRGLLSEEQLLKFDALKGKRGKMQRGDSRKPGMQRGQRSGRGA